MNRNDVLRKLRYIFDCNDDKMMAIFALAEHAVTRAEVSNWLKPDDHAENQLLSDRELAIFLNGLINDLRGRKEGVQPHPEEFLTNNIILRKLKIALNYREDDILTIFKMAEVNLSRHELSAFFRKPSQDKYRLCKDQYLRNFLRGLQLKFRG